MPAFITRAPAQRPSNPGIAVVAGVNILVRPAGEILGGHRIVYINSDGKAYYASNTILSDSVRALGITLNAAAVDDNVSIQSFGEVIETSWSWTMGSPIYLSSNGQLTQTPPVSPALFQRIIGFPLTTTSLFFSFREPIILV